MSTVTDRMAEALIGAIILFVIGAAAQDLATFDAVFDMNPQQLVFWGAVLINGIGLLTSIYFSGILFGPVGFYFESIGASMLLNAQNAGLGWLAIGAATIILGRPTWQALKELFGSNF